MKIVLATRNPHKAAELCGRLAAAGVEIVSLEAFDVPPVDETGSTFLENAAIKAEAARRATGLWALGEDSGLEVDALGGAPGVHSARYAGEEASDEENNEKLLRSLAGVPRERRTARFRTAMVLFSPDGSSYATEGSCEGRILESPRGTGGFGYDSLFVPAGEERSFAEMSREEKEAISHRTRALVRMVEVIQRLSGAPW